MKTTGWMAAAVLMLASGSSSADVLRCGGTLVEAGTSAQELVAQCGEPAGKSIEGFNWTYNIDGHSYEVRVSDGGVVAEIKQLDE